MFFNSKYFHYQFYTHQYATKVVITTRTYQWTHDMVVNENNFRKGFFEVLLMNIVIADPTHIDMV
jgi:hypothetical protein